MRLFNLFKDSTPVGFQGVKERSTSIYFKYPREFDFEGKLILNAGCGKAVYPAPNVINLDFSKGEGIQIAHDLAITPLPFKDNTFDYIIINHVLEHIPNWFDCFADLARILKPGGGLEVWIPTMATDASFTYRDHINYLGLGSFCGVANLIRSSSNIEGNKHKDVRALKLVQRDIKFIKDWYVRFAPDWLKFWMHKHLRNIASEEGFVFEKATS